MNRLRWSARVGAVALLAALALDGGAASAFWTADPLSVGTTSAAAASVGPGATPTTTARQDAVTVTWDPSVLSTGMAVSGYRVLRYAPADPAPHAALTGCAGTITTTTCVETGVPEGVWSYTVTPVLATHWTGAESAPSLPVAADATAPSTAVTLTDAAGRAAQTGSTIYYRGDSAGTFALTSTVTDALSGPASSTTQELAGTTNGWVHAPSTVSAPTGGPYASGTFSWLVGTRSAPTVTVTGRDVAGNATSTALTFVDDSVAPLGGGVSHAVGVTAARSVVIDLADATDAGSGIARRLLQRATATLSADTCGAFGGFETVPDGVDPVSPVVDAIVAGRCYVYQLVVTDRVGNSTTAPGPGTVSVPTSYAGTIRATAGLLSYWRLGESAAPPETFTGSAGQELTTTSSGSSWTRSPSSTGHAVLTSDGRARLADDGGSSATYFSPVEPTDLNYSVEADLYVATTDHGDLVGVVGRGDPTADGISFAAAYDQRIQSWVLLRLESGLEPVVLSQSADALVPGTTYHLSLTMRYETLELRVDGDLRTETEIWSDPWPNGNGRGGFYLGAGDSAPSDAQGLHLDDVDVLVPTTKPMTDSAGTSDGTYANGPRLGVTGALAGDSDTAARFDGTSSGTVPRQISADFSIELWFATTDTQGSTSGDQWYQGNGLVDGEVGGVTDDFGVALFGDGSVVAGVGNPDVSIVSAPGYNDGRWHHVVLTRTQWTGEIVLYVDGEAVGSATGSQGTLEAPPELSIGRLQTWYTTYRGLLDEIAVYDVALSAETVRAHTQAAG